jgi:hypothetical protein
LLVEAYPLLAAEPSLSITMVADLIYFHSAACLTWLLVLEIRTNAMLSVVKYSVRK